MHELNVLILHPVTVYVFVQDDFLESEEVIPAAKKELALA